MSEREDVSRKGRGFYQSLYDVLESGHCDSLSPESVTITALLPKHTCHFSHEVVLHSPNLVSGLALDLTSKQNVAKGAF